MKIRINKIILFSLLSFLFWGCSTSKYHRLDETRKIIDVTFQDSLFSHAHWGVLIESLDSGEIWYEHHADKMFIPASNEKIVTSAAALLTLGPEFKFETKLNYTGEIIDSILIGNLIVQGNGDPTFSTKFYDDPRTLFYCWADTLLELGIAKISGNIIGDDNAFDDNGYGLGWSFDDLNYSYAAETGALQFNNNSIKLQIIPPVNLNNSVKIYPEIKSSYFSILDNTTTSANGKTKLTVDRSFSSNEITISGNVTTGSRAKWRSVSITNPTLYFINIFKEVLSEKGIETEGSSLDCDDIEDWEFDKENAELIAINHSPPLSEILQVMMKESNNLYAETVVKTMGWQENGMGSFKNGQIAVDSVLAAWGIEPGTYAYRDGSGLSRYNLISPRQIIQILKKMKSDENWSLWKDLFPIAGVDGTMQYRMIGTPGEGNVRAKTGTMSNVRCLSGYLTTSEGEEIVFSFLINGHLRKSKEIDNVIDHILNQLIINPKKRK